MLITSLLYLFMAPAVANEQPCTLEEIQIACGADNHRDKNTCALPDDFKTNKSQYCTVKTEATKPQIEQFPQEKTPSRIDDHKSTVSMKASPSAT